MNKLTENSWRLTSFVADHLKIHGGWLVLWFEWIIMSQWHPINILPTLNSTFTFQLLYSIYPIFLPPPFFIDVHHSPVYLYPFPADKGPIGRPFAFNEVDIQIVNPSILYPVFPSYIIGIACSLVELCKKRDRREDFRWQKNHSTQDSRVVPHRGTN